ncbi:MAG: protein-L-isoaspartate(D-aspartate) O-methyltransferase [Thermodesulfobacteriota bacterium]
MNPDLSKINTDDQYAQKRWEMVENQIISRGITNKRVIEAMLNVKRHLFVPPRYLDSAYGDNPVPIEKGQTVSQPYMVALMTDLIKPAQGKKILEIGTGSGYQTAVLAESGCDVFSIEIHEDIALKARDVLEELGYKNISFKIGDGYQGWEEHAPYEGIIVTAAPKDVPDILIDQLCENGTMVIPVGDESQELVVIEKRGGIISTKRITSVRFVPMTKA